MKQTADWATRISLLAIVAVCVAIAWRLSSNTSPGAEPVAAAGAPEASVARAVVKPDRDLHATAGSPSPLERLFKAGASDAGVGDSRWRYRLDHPDHTYRVVPALDGISDLGISDDAKSLWVVTGEKGTVYRLLISDGSLAEAINFGPLGEYEGIESVDGGIFVARTDATVFAIDARDGGISSFTTPLGPTCTLSGLGYEARRERLLLVCKFPMPKLPTARKSFAIYAMNVETRRVLNAPVIVLPRQAIDDYLGTHPDQPGLKPSMGDEFTPTAIAVHPGTGQLFLLSGRGTMLVVLEASGSLTRIEALDPGIHPHPKGLTFGPDGTLFIGNASRGSHGLIQRYAQVKE